MDLPVQLVGFLYRTSRSTTTIQIEIPTASGGLFVEPTRELLPPRSGSLDTLLGGTSSRISLETQPFGGLGGRAPVPLKLLTREAPSCLPRYCRAFLLPHGLHPAQPEAEPVQCTLSVTVITNIIITALMDSGHTPAAELTTTSTTWVLLQMYSYYSYCHTVELYSERRLSSTGSGKDDLGKHWQSRVNGFKLLRAGASDFYLVYTPDDAQVMIGGPVYSGYY
eukprot:3573624-Rhodomonas_salina.3